MIFEENDIDFLTLTDRQFEELCFDLLVSTDYQGLIWRQGGADSGRDIEGKRTVNNPLIGSYQEKWFFECKRFENAVSPEKLNSKIAWADAENPQHLVFFISSYLSNNARTWIEKIAINKSYAIHILEGKNLKRLILGFPEIVKKYFSDPYSKLLLEHRRSWLIHNIIPEPETICLLANNLDLKRLSEDELAFFWCVSKIRSEEIDRWIEDNEPFYMTHFFKPLANLSNTIDSVLSDFSEISPIVITVGMTPYEEIYSKFIAARLGLNLSKKPREALYSFVRDSEGEGVEVLIEASSAATGRGEPRRGPEEQRQGENGFGHFCRNKRTLEIFPIRIRFRSVNVLDLQRQVNSGLLK